MFNRILFFVCALLVSGLLYAQEQSIDIVLLKKSEPEASAFVPADTEETGKTNDGSPREIEAKLSGFRLALTKELEEKNLDSEKFWKFVEDKKLDDKGEYDYLKTFFQTEVLLSSAANSEDKFDRYVLKFDLNKQNFDTVAKEVFNIFTDYTVKTFYIIPEINIAADMTWEDVGVTRSENFAGVIADSWKKWAEEKYKNFHVVILDKDFAEKPESMNRESVTLKWTSMLKKTESFPDRKSARYELSAQYILVNTKTNQSMLAFDFPNQKRELSVVDSKELSSSLASLVFNLLNSQTVKVSSALELNQASGTLNVVEAAVTGRHSLFDITQITNVLKEHFKSIALSTEMKSYSSNNSVITFKSTATSEMLFEMFATQVKNLELNEKNLLHFDSNSKTFAIIPKQANN